jgi:hypothetical protein
MSNIHQSIKHLAVPIETLVPLEGNPRKGNVDAIMASYREFGQVKPVVVRRNPDGTATVIAGNHQVEACRRLGWAEVAVIELPEADEARAIAYALADNRTVELGSTDDDLLFEMLERADGYDDLFESLGWDDFELESMLSNYETDDSEGGYVAPVMIPTPDFQNAPTIIPPIEVRPNATAMNDGTNDFVAPSSVNTNTAVTQGAPAIVNVPTKAVVQYTLVFDTAEQQRKWYDFIRWLKSDPSYDGTTTAERLLNFIDAHANY